LSTRRQLLGVVAGIVSGGQEVAKAAAAALQQTGMPAVGGSARRVHKVIFGAETQGPVPDYTLQEIAKLRRWASGDFTDDELAEHDGGGTIDNPDADLYALKSVSDNAKRAIVHARWRERHRRSFMVDAVRRLSNTWGIKV
jgi:hypothetical protein